MYLSMICRRRLNNTVIFLAPSPSKTIYAQFGNVFIPNNRGKSH